MKRKPNRKELYFVAFEADVWHGLPQRLHVVRKSADLFTRASCGKKGKPAMLWPFNEWIFEQNSMLCAVCHDKLFYEIFAEKIDGGGE